MEKQRSIAAFAAGDPQQWVTWESNGAAWMTSAIFNGWLRNFNQRMRSMGRRVVLTMDNASCHKVMNASPEVLFGMEVYRLSNVTVVMLPKNTTAVVQPMDAGIIRSFKARYKEWLCEQLFQLYEAVDWSGDLSKVRPNVGRCVIEAARIWNSIPDGLIYNCVRSTGILPEQWRDLQVNEPMTALQLIRDASVAVQYMTDNMARALP